MWSTAPQMSASFPLLSSHLPPHNWLSGSSGNCPQSLSSLPVLSASPFPQQAILPPSDKGDGLGGKSSTIIKPRLAEQGRRKSVNAHAFGCSAYRRNTTGAKSTCNMAVQPPTLLAPSWGQCYLQKAIPSSCKARGF